MSSAATEEGTAALPHVLDDGIGHRARLGLIVLATDQTIEHEWRLMLSGLDGVALYAVRLWNDAEITPETLLLMADRIGPAAKLLMPVLPLHVIAFGCTSGTMVIGERRVAELIIAERPEARITTPIGAAFAGLRALNSKRIALLTPYRADVNERLRAYVEARGFSVTKIGTFDEADDSRAARITAASVRDAAIKLGRDPDVEAVFVSCTSLRTVDLLPEVEAAINKPMISSNHAMAWQALRVAGIDEALPRFGRLFSQPLA